MNQTIEQVYGAWEKAFNSGNREAVRALYEQDASLVAQPGEVVKGQENIGKVLDAFFALKGQIQFDVKLVIPGNGVSLAIADWSLEGTDPTGEVVKIGGRTSDVLRRQADGRWLLAIDNPYGAQAI